MKNMNLRSKVATFLSALVIGVTAVIPTTPVYGANNDPIGVSNLYKLDNVDPKTGCGDYLLEVKLQDGWVPYAQVQLSTTNFTFCDAFHAGKPMGNSTDRYVWAGTKGCILEDTDNGGYMIMGKITNPTNGILEIPLKICAEHREDVVYGDNASVSIAVSEKAAAGIQVYNHLYFKDAKPISQRGNTQGGTQLDQKGKEYVQFTVNEGTYMLGNVGGVKGNNQLKSMAVGEATFMANGRTMVPVRYAGEALGCTIEWNPAKREAIVKASNNTYRLPLNSQYAYDTKGTKYDLGAKTAQKNGRTYVAVGALGRLLNCEVDWNEQAQTVTFSAK